nr:MAG TPA: hypothetical protein [Caudoviricetes sp.]DAS26257.1 MAG TPA: hypothetical protein [Caudoviricetes sp.]
MRQEFPASLFSSQFSCKIRGGGYICIHNL